MDIRSIEIIYSLAEFLMPYSLLLSALICLGAKLIADEVEYRQWRKTIKE